MRTLVTLIFLAAGIVASSCAVTREPTPSSTASISNETKLSRDEVIQIAERCAAEHGRRLENYEVMSVGVKLADGKARWSVFFNGTGEYVQPDIFFTVEIDDATKATTFRGALGGK